MNGNLGYPYIDFVCIRKIDNNMTGDTCLSILHSMEKTRPIQTDCELAKHTRTKEPQAFLCTPTSDYVSDARIDNVDLKAHRCNAISKQKDDDKNISRGSVDETSFVKTDSVCQDGTQHGAVVKRESDEHSDREASKQTHALSYEIYAAQQSILILKFSTPVHQNYYNIKHQDRLKFISLEHTDI